MKDTRQITFAAALREAQDQALERDPAVYLMGLGVPDPKGIFGSTTGLAEKYGPHRVMDMPLAENAMTGVAIGSALVGMRPILSHQRVDFALTSMEQLINQAAKWHSMFGGKMNVPLVVRMIVGRGWGQGPQHSQSLQAMFAHVPGLKVVMPTTAYDAKGLLIAAIEDNNPVVMLEHRWLYSMVDYVPAEYYRVPLGRAATRRPGRDVTIIGTSYMTVEALKAADSLASMGVDAEVLDLRTLQPLDEASILKSVRRTGRVVVADTGSKAYGAAAEIVAMITERAFNSLASPPVRVALPNRPTPTSPTLSADFYPRAPHIVAAALQACGRDASAIDLSPPAGQHLDQPDPSFTGPF